MFFTSAPCSCVSLRDFVKLIVGAFFYFFNKNELEKKISTASLEKVTVQVCNNCSELSSASQEPIWPSFGQTLKMFIKKKDDKEKQREKILEMSWISIGYAPLGLFALKDEHVLVYVNKPFYHQTAMPVSSTANSVLWQKQKQTKKEIYPANQSLVSRSLILLSVAHPRHQLGPAWGDWGGTGGTCRQAWETALRRLASPGPSRSSHTRSVVFRLCSSGRQQQDRLGTWKWQTLGVHLDSEILRVDSGCLRELSGWLQCALKFETHRTRGLDTDCSNCKANPYLKLVGLARERAYFCVRERKRDNMPGNGKDKVLASPHPSTEALCYGFQEMGCVGLNIPSILLSFSPACSLWRISLPPTRSHGKEGWKRLSAN